MSVKPINIGEVRAILRAELPDSASGRERQASRLRRILRLLRAELKPKRLRVQALELWEGILEQEIQKRSTKPQAGELEDDGGYP